MALVMLSSCPCPASPFHLFSSKLPDPPASTKSIPFSPSHHCVKPSSSITLSSTLGMRSTISAAIGNGELADADSLPQGEAARRCLRHVFDGILALPADFLRTLPEDLKVDLKDTAFALASGAVRRECGQQMGEVLVEMSHALEVLDTQALTEAAEKLERTLPHKSSFRNELGKRMLAAGRHLSSTGEYGKGELQKIARALIATGDVLQTGNVQKPEGAADVETSRMYKFGELQVKLTSQRSYSGSGVALAFGTLAWRLTAALQNVPDSSLKYANDNAYLLATSLKGTLLVLGFSCTILSAFTMIGLFILGTQLASKKK